MKKFQYIAVNKKGEKVTGDYEANTPEDVAGLLMESNLTPVKISEKIDLNGIFQPSVGQTKVPNKEKVIFLREFSTMISAGLPIDDALEVAIAQTAHPAFKRVLTEMVKSIRTGGSFASAMEKFPRTFSNVEINLVKAGEVSGKMDVIMIRLADDTEKQNLLQTKVQGALSYPIFVLGIAAIVVGVITVKLVPAMQGLYQGFGSSSLPLPTEILVLISNFITNDWWIALLLLIIAYLLFRYYKGTPDGALAIDKGILKIPIIGALITQYQIVTLIKTYAMLLASGIPVITSLDLVAESVSNRLFTQALQESSKEVEKGISLANALAKYEFIPSIVWRSIAIGEETGKTEDILTKIGKYFEERVNDQVNNLTRLLEPLLLVVLGGIVGFIAVAIYLPIYSFSSVVH